MCRTVFTLGIVVMMVVCGISIEAAASGADEAALRKAMEAYAQAYNKGDAGAMASHWSKQGEYVAPSGERFKGPEKIRPALESALADNRGMQVKVAIFEVIVQSPQKATERGFAVFQRPGEQERQVLLAASYVKEDGAWKLVSVEEDEVPVPLSTIGQLGQLEWLIGEWVDQDDQAEVETVFGWADNYSFMKGSFRVHVGGRIDVEGTQIIGWDPAAKEIRSWIFDSRGGFGEGVWSREGNQWHVKLKSVLGTGQKASSINIYTYVDPNTYLWKAIGREVDGQPLPNVDQVTVVRKQAQKAKTKSGK